MKQTEMMEKQDGAGFGSLSNDAPEEITTETHEVAAEEVTAPRLPLPLRLFRRMELLGLQVDYAKMAKGRAGEEWFVGRGGVVQGPVTFREILEYLVDGGGTVEVIHASEKENEEAQWSELSHTPFWSQTWPARICTSIFWGIAALLGYGLIGALVPAAVRMFAEIGYLVVVVGLVGFAFYRRAKKPAEEETEDSTSEGPAGKP